MIYKIHFGREDYIAGGSGGFCYAGSKAEVMRELHRHVVGKEETLEGQWPNYEYHQWSVTTLGSGRLGVTAIEITWEQTPRTKAEWIDYLNKHGEHPDNG